jgi:hypothetical protein
MILLNLILMTGEKEAKICGVHERFMGEFKQQIGAALHNIRGPTSEDEFVVRQNNSRSILSVSEVQESLQEEHGGADKINDIRNEVAATQSAEAGQSATILDPDKQRELMEIVRQRSEDFERELHRIPSLDYNNIESATQKFKDQLMDDIRRQLMEKKYIFMQQ